jgi:hypothetical protein
MTYRSLQARLCRVAVTLMDLAAGVRDGTPVDVGDGSLPTWDSNLDWTPPANYWSQRRSCAQH